MDIGSREWKEILIEGASAINVPINADIADQFAIHANELIKWAKKTNLTTITAPLDVAVKHFLDSIAPVSNIPVNSNVLDIGSGGGFPGIPLKIVMPSLSMTLIDAARKKVSFLNHVIRTLGLHNIHARQIRVEDINQPEDLENGYDVIICRAFSSLDAFVEKAMPLLNREGRIIALKGKISASEIKAVHALASRLRQMFDMGKFECVVTTKQYKLPYLESKRSIITLRFLI